MFLFASFIYFFSKVATSSQVQMCGCLWSLTEEFLACFEIMIFFFGDLSAVPSEISSEGGFLQHSSSRGSAEQEGFSISS